MHTCSSPAYLPFHLSAEAYPGETAFSLVCVTFVCKWSGCLKAHSEGRIFF